jgi:hypothetical protein
VTCTSELPFAVYVKEEGCFRELLAQFKYEEDARNYIDGVKRDYRKGVFYLESEKTMEII